MTVLHLTRPRQGADPSRHNPLRISLSGRQCPDSPTGYHLRRRGELRCICYRCRLPLTAPASAPPPAVPEFGDNIMTIAMAPTVSQTVRTAHAMAEKLLDASIEGSPAESRYGRLAALLERAMTEIGQGVQS